MEEHGEKDTHCCFKIGQSLAVVLSWVIEEGEMVGGWGGHVLGSSWLVFVVADANLLLFLTGAQLFFSKRCTASLLLVV